MVTRKQTLVNPKRIRQLNSFKIFNNGPVVYWMSRDQRAEDNWALLYAQQLAGLNDTHVIVIFNLVPQFLGATIRQYDFMLKGLQETQENLSKFGIPFHLLQGDPATNISSFLKENSASVLVTDFDPLKTKQQWKNQVMSRISIPFYEVDTHNIVPCWHASNKQEYAAHTLRPKINKQLLEFLDDFPKLEPQQLSKNPPKINPDSIINNLKINFSVPATDIKPGAIQAKSVLNQFISSNLKNYHLLRNNPNKQVVSGLSPYLHFGQISAQRIALRIQASNVSDKAKEAFLEELIVRRELADNFCFYNQNYNSVEGFPGWAKKSLDEHRNDERDYVYPVETFENASTHDDLWNACQKEMVNTGKMHGYMRMYWAKKIFEWNNSPEKAMQIAIYLNDKYELDGRDPNGYTGIAWSMGGVHDRPWFERPVFGKIRFMNYNGAKKKFNVTEYMQKYI